MYYSKIRKRVLSSCFEIYVRLHYRITKTVQCRSYAHEKYTITRAQTFLNLSYVRFFGGNNDVNFRTRSSPRMPTSGGQSRRSELEAAANICTTATGANVFLRKSDVSPACGHARYLKFEVNVKDPLSRSDKRTVKVSQHLFRKQKRETCTQI